MYIYIYSLYIYDKACIALYRFDRDRFVLDPPVKISVANIFMKFRLRKSRCKERKKKKKSRNEWACSRLLSVDLRRKIRNACDKYVFHTQKRMCMLCVSMYVLCVCVCVCVSARKKKRKRKIKYEEKYSSKYCHLDRPAYHRYGLLETLICKCTLMDIYTRDMCHR